MVVVTANTGNRLARPAPPTSCVVIREINSFCAEPTPRYYTDANEVAGLVDRVLELREQLVGLPKNTISEQAAVRLSSKYHQFHWAVLRSDVFPDDINDPRVPKIALAQRAKNLTQLKL